MSSQYLEQFSKPSKGRGSYTEDYRRTVTVIGFERFAMRYSASTVNPYMRVTHIAGNYYAIETRA